MSITGTKQGLITAGAFTEDSVGNTYQEGHEDQVMVQGFNHEVIIPRDPQSGQPTGQRVHKPVVITKVFDKASPAGRGFAVVADEVRNLAHRAQESAQQIQKMIEELQIGAQEAVSTMTESQRYSLESVEIANRAGERLSSVTGRIAAFLRSARSQVGPAFGEGRAVARHFHRRDPLAGALGAGVHARRPADLDALEDLDLLPVGNLPVARQVDRQRPGGGRPSGPLRPWHRQPLHPGQLGFSPDPLRTAAGTTVGAPGAVLQLADLPGEECSGDSPGAAQGTPGARLRTAHLP